MLFQIYSRNDRANIWVDVYCLPQCAYIPNLVLEICLCCLANSNCHCQELAGQHKQIWHQAINFCSNVQSDTLWASLPDGAPPWKHIPTSQEVGGTLIGEDELMVMTGVEFMERYQIHQAHGFHVFWCHSICAIPAIIMSRPPLSSLHCPTSNTTVSRMQCLPCCRDTMAWGIDLCLTKPFLSEAYAFSS
jgi:hypothetical protein